MTELGAAIRRLLDERHLSLRAAAAQAHWNPGYLSQVINGKRKGSDELARDLDRVLGTGGELAAIWEASEGPRIARSLSEATAASFPGTSDLTPPAARVTAEGATAILQSWHEGLPHPGIQVLTAQQVGLSEIERLETTVDMFRIWDHERGGVLGRRAATGQLADIAEVLAHPHPEPLRRRLFGVTARMSIVVAHMSADAGLDGHGARYLDLALEAAQQAGDRELGARAVNAIARRILEAGQPQEAAALLRYARASLPGISPSLTALLYTTEAWASAALGDYDTAEPCLEQAAVLASGDGNVGPAEVAGVAGACYETLAAAASGHKRALAAARAEQCITAALELREPYYVRSRVLDMAGLARVRLLQDEPGESMTVASSALDAAVGVRSRRAAHRLHELAITALDQYPTVRAVPEFADAVRTRLPL